MIHHWKDIFFYLLTIDLRGHDINRNVNLLSRKLLNIFFYTTDMVHKSLEKGIIYQWCEGKQTYGKEVQSQHFPSHLTFANVSLDLQQAILRQFSLPITFVTQYLCTSDAVRYSYRLTTKFPTAKPLLQLLLSITLSFHCTPWIRSYYEESSYYRDFCNELDQNYDTTHYFLRTGVPGPLNSLHLPA